MVTHVIYLACTCAEHETCKNTWLGACMVVMKDCMLPSVKWDDVLLQQW